MKQISIIVKYFYPVAAGIETNIMETYTVLQKKGWNIEVHTSRDTLTEKNVLKEKELIRGLTVIRYPFTKFAYFPEIDWDKVSIVALHNFDIFPHLKILSYVLALKILRRKKFQLVLTPHGGYTPEWSIFPPIQRVIKKIYHLTLGGILINSTVDVVRAVSDWEKDEIIKYGVKKSLVAVIPNGVEQEAYANVDAHASDEIKERVKSFGKYIIQVGRVYPIKNYETTIRALAKINSSIKFVIVGPEDHVMGKSDYKEELLHLAKSLKVENRVIFAGVLRGVDKYYIIGKAQMMVHMAIWESFCNVVHEGLSQGLVCIVANNTALPYLIKNKINGFCVETRDMNAVANKIQYVLDNKNSKIISEMEARNKIYGLENSWEKVAQEVDKLYTALNQ